MTNPASAALRPYERGIEESALRRQIRRADACAVKRDALGDTTGGHAWRETAADLRRRLTEMEVR